MREREAVGSVIWLNRAPGVITVEPSHPKPWNYKSGKIMEEWMHNKMLSSRVTEGQALCWCRNNLSTHVCIANTWHPTPEVSASSLSCSTKDNMMAQSKAIPSFQIRALPTCWAKSHPSKDFHFLWAILADEFCLLHYRIQLHFHKTLRTVMTVMLITTLLIRPKSLKYKPETNVITSEW